jgi:erythromycin esterase
MILELKSNGPLLSGAVSGPSGEFAIANGHVSGDSISFDMTVAEGGKAKTVSCRGQLVGESLEMTASAAGLPESKLTFTRRAPGAPLPDWFAAEPAPGAVVDWIRKNLMPLSSVKPSGSFSDLAPLSAKLKDARIVGMGEATHGTREFQQFKLRMFQFLVQELGFTIFGLEANWPETLRINDYVHGGKGDLDELMSSSRLAVWWRTEDLRSVIAWMRAYNQDAAHTRKLKFYGFDMVSPALAEANVASYLKRVDPEASALAQKIFALLGEAGENPAYEHAAPAVKRETADAISKILSFFDQRRAEYIKTTSLQEWTNARQNMVIVKEAEVRMTDPKEPGSAYRDQAMAENAHWVLDHEPPGSKMMLWAHNAHVALDGILHAPMGSYLRKTYGTAFVSCGFAFNEGTFKALNTLRQEVPFTVGPGPQGSLDTTLASIGIPQFALDLRNIAADSPAAWFRDQHRSRQVGGSYSADTPGVYLHPMRAAREFDLLFFIGKSSPIALLPN